MAPTMERITTLSNHLKAPAKMATSYKFQGWLGLDKEAVNGKMEWKEFEPKTWTEDDVDIKVTHCGICGSDLHTLRSGWVLFPFPFPFTSFHTKYTFQSNS